MKRALLVILCLALLVVAVASMAAAPNAPKPNVNPNWWGKAPGQKPIANGTVANVSATNIAVQTPQGVKAFTVGPKTKVAVAGKKATIADVKVGMPVSVQFKLTANNVPMALRVVVPKPTFKGKITAIDGNAITIKGKKGELHVNVSAATKFNSHGYVGALADLRVGYSITARGSAADNVITAEAIEFQPTAVRGAVVAMDANTITVKTVKQLTFVTAPSAKTVVRIRPRVGPNTKGTLADVKVGSPVNIGFTAVKGGTSPLLWIEVLTGT
jgi:hypothetical protein